jgi:flagellar basal body-associated protein FliL
MIKFNVKSGAIVGSLIVMIIIVLIIFIISYFIIHFLLNQPFINKYLVKFGFKEGLSSREDYEKCKEKGGSDTACGYTSHTPSDI